MKDSCLIKKSILYPFVFTLLSFCGHKTDKTNPLQSSYEEKRQLMVQKQIVSRGINDQKIIDAMLKVQRHLFVPAQYRDQAYEDHPLPIGHGQTISQPYIVAYMTYTLNLEATDKVLEIGTGSGYQAAILAEIVDSVYTIEIVEDLGLSAKKTLKDLGYANIKVKIGNGYKGWKAHSPFNAIIVTCAPTHIPVPLKEQLAEGGKMIIPVGNDYVQHLVLLTKRKGKIKKETVLPVRFVPMVNENGELY